MKLEKWIWIAIMFLLVGIMNAASIFIIHQNKTEKTSDKEFAEESSFYPSLWMDYQRTYPYAYIKPEAYREAMQQAALSRREAAGLRQEWIFEGPSNVGGRITDLAVHPSDPNTIYVGAATGGVLKSSDGGITWINTFSEVPVISIGALAINPNDPDVIYAGTGEANSSSYSFMGDGLYKSFNAGETWQNIGLTESAYIGRIVVDYNNSDRIFVAACGNLFSYGGERGVYRTVNGGEEWEQVLFVNDSTSAIDLVQDPANPDILYAAMWERTRGRDYRNSFGDGSGIWKSTDGGDTWEELTNGLPTGNDVGRIGLAIAASNPDVLFAIYDMPDSEVEVYKTTDGGNNWSETTNGALYGMNSSFGWYFGQIRIDPVNENRVFALGMEMYRTNNGGASWQQIAGYDNFYEIHVDHHAMYIDQNTGRVFEGNDGGLYISDNYGDDWQKLNTLAITQFYDITVDEQLPQRIYGGTQDNNTIRTMTGAVNDWQAILGGDGFYCLVDYTFSDIIYAEWQWGNLSRSTDGGWNFDYIADQMQNDRINWSAPVVMHPEFPNILYFGTHRVWKTMNGGNSWTPVSGDLTKGGEDYFHTITTLAVSSIDPGIVMAGSADGKVHISTDGALSWTDISDGLPDRWITRVATDPFDENTIYATVSGFRWDEPEAHVFKSTDMGENWVSISGNLPDLPVNVLSADPENEGFLFVGTDAGVFYTENGGESWTNVMFDLPNVPVTAMKIHNPTRQLIIGTFGISAYSLNLDQLVAISEKKAKESPAKLTCYPNPVKVSAGSVTIVTASGFDVGSEVVISNMAGRKMAVLYPETGSTKIIWNLTQGTGKRVAPGVYLVHISTGGNISSAKVIVTN